MEFNHETVLLREATEGLNIKPDGIYVDCTLGGAGHAALILEQLSDEGHLYAFDQDSTAIEHAKILLKDQVTKKKITFIQSNFRYLKESLNELSISKVDGILYDLGVSSPQLDNAERGFSYHQDAVLDMRMNRDQELSAHDVVNKWEYSDLVRIFSDTAKRSFLNRSLEK